MVVVTLFGGVCSGLGAVFHALCTNIAIFYGADIITFQNISSKYFEEVFLALESEKANHLSSRSLKLLEQLAYHINITGDLQAG